MLIVLLMSVCVCVSSHGGYYHENSALVFEPDSPADYFGYTLVFQDADKQTSDGPRMIVGAPKAFIREPIEDNSIRTGAVFSCPLSAADDDVTHNVTCEPIYFDTTELPKDAPSFLKDEMRDGMWLGATVVPLAGNTLVACAPRRVNQHGKTHPYGSYGGLGGACYISPANKTYKSTIQVYSSTNNLYQMHDGEVITLYANQQMGVSGKLVSARGSTWILFGVPGFREGSGGVIPYKVDVINKKMYNFLKKDIIASNPLKRLLSFAYLGYSVDAGDFYGKGDILMVAGAPRGDEGFGQVILFNLKEELNKWYKIEKILQSVDYGSYFGATVCVIDLNNDGRADLLVGAPLYIHNKSSGYDQGAVFVYKNLPNAEGFALERKKTLFGSNAIRARFGSAIADLGSINGDMYNDVAIGAPWEDEGRGAVYIYLGTMNGVNENYVQRISSSGFNGFGISISKHDLNLDLCNDIAVGAYDSGKAVILKCIPQVGVSIELQIFNETKLTVNTEELSGIFCIYVHRLDVWKNVTLDLKADIELVNVKAISPIDKITYTINVKSVHDVEQCQIHSIKINTKIDLSRPLTLTFSVELLNNLTESKRFPKNQASISADSALMKSKKISLTRNCGSDLVCTPLLQMNLTSLSSSPYVPGSREKLGFKVQLTNIGEPAYSSCVTMTLAIPIKRVPIDCVKDGDANMTCNVPSGMLDEDVSWDIEMQEQYVMHEVYELMNNVTVRNFCSEVSDYAVTIEHVIEIEPKFNINIFGKQEPNVSLPPIQRKQLAKGSLIPFTHIYEITNIGPSNVKALEINITLPPEVNITRNVTNCSGEANLLCVMDVTANSTKVIHLDMHFDPTDKEKIFEDSKELSIITTAEILSHNINKTCSVVTSLSLSTLSYLPYILGFIGGVILLIILILILYKCGFFRRRKYEVINEGEHSQQTTERLSKDESKLIDSNTISIEDTKENSIYMKYDELNINLSK